MSSPNTFWLSLVRFSNRHTKNSRALRQVGIEIYKSVIQLNKFLPAPQVLLNGPPKSGTHLLSDCLSLMPKMMFSGRHFALTDFFTSDTAVLPSGHPVADEQRLTAFLKRCPQGMFVTAHARFHPVLSSLIERLQFKHIFLLRDPRDIAVSHVFHVKREPLHPQHQHFTKVLNNDEERLMETIGNLKLLEGATGVPPRSAFDTLAGSLPWLTDPSTLVVRFEDLIGPQGGGDPVKQLDTIKRIGAFVERPLGEEHAHAIAHKMYGKQSSTFRKGQIGDWPNHFSNAHRDAFKEVMGERLIALGYEQNMNW